MQNQPERADHEEKQKPPLGAVAVPFDELSKEEREGHNGEAPEDKDGHEDSDTRVAAETEALRADALGNSEEAD